MYLSTTLHGGTYQHSSLALTAIGYGLGHPGFTSRQGQDIFHLPKTPTATPGHTQPPHSMNSGGLSSWVKRPRREAARLSASNTDVLNEWSCIPPLPLYASMAWTVTTSHLLLPHKNIESCISLRIYYGCQNKRLLCRLVSQTGDAMCFCE
jgi:hypothetical protein